MSCKILSVNEVKYDQLLKDMPMNTNTLNNAEYDAKRISDLFLAAKGPQRTGAEFCKECDISAPTFSRYVNGHNKRPCPAEMLRKIAEHADPDSKVTYDQLLAANGGHASYDYGSKVELSKNELLGIIIPALFSERYECRPPQNATTIDIMGLTYNPDLSINTNAVDGQTMLNWQFVIYKEFDDLSGDADRFIRQLLLLVSSVHLGFLTTDKLTFVFSNSALYKEICKRTEVLKLDFLVSFLLLDPVAHTIREEHHVANTLGNTLQSIFATGSSQSNDKNSLLSVAENNIL